MKKVALLSLAACAALAGVPGAPSAWSLDWQLPVTTVRVETESGSSEDPDDGVVAPDSLRATASLRVREEASPLVLGVTVRASWKDYVDQAGDYRYVEVEHDGSLKLSPAVKLGWALGVKDTVFAELSSSGLDLDTTALKASASAAWTIAKGTALDAALAGKFALADDPSRAAQAWSLSASFTTKLGGWVFGARYRGELRLPLGPASGVTLDADHTGALTAEWDPNR